MIEISLLAKIKKNNFIDFNKDMQISWSQKSEFEYFCKYNSFIKDFTDSVTKSFEYEYILWEPLKQNGFVMHFKREYTPIMGVYYSQAIFC